MTGVGAMLAHGQRIFKAIPGRNPSISQVAKPLLFKLTLRTIQPHSPRGVHAIFGTATPDRHSAQRSCR
jgi:hypothetical protein